MYRPNIEYKIYFTVELLAVSGVTLGCSPKLSDNLFMGSIKRRILRLKTSLTTMCLVFQDPPIYKRSLIPSPKIRNNFLNIFHFLRNSIPLFYRLKVIMRFYKHTQNVQAPAIEII